MSKAIVRIGYNDYVVDVSDAVKIMEIMSKAQHYKIKRDYGTTPTSSSYHVWDQEMDADSINVQLLPDAVYRVAKLAGKPKDN
jgi:hypothetical protein